MSKSGMMLAATVATVLLSGCATNSPNVGSSAAALYGQKPACSPCECGRHVCKGQNACKGSMSEK